MQEKIVLNGLKLLRFVKITDKNLKIYNCKYPCVNRFQNCEKLSVTVPK